MDIYALQLMEYLLLIQQIAYLLTIEYAFKIMGNFATSQEIKPGVTSIMILNFALQSMEFFAINSYLDGILL